VTRWGKPTDPNIVLMDEAAPARFYPDFADDAGSAHADGPVNSPELRIDEPRASTDARPTSGGFTDVGSRKFEYAKWTATGVTAGLVVIAIGAYAMQINEENNIVNDSTSCGAPPCRQFDHQFDQAFQDSAKQYATISNVTLGIGIVTGAVAGYLWYRDLTASPRAEVQTGAKQHASSQGLARTWVLAPSVSERFAGAAAVGRF
jgi:hypothetical protein